MEKMNILDNIPVEGFIKVRSQKIESLSASQKAGLIRKGNELFNSGKVELAERIFLSTGYTDGIIRVGDAYYKKKETLKALRMYWLAPAVEKKEMLIEEISAIIKKWIKEK